MKHIHFDSCPSTQIYLQEKIDNLLSDDKDILVSTSQQTEGRGRYGREWRCLPHSLAFSFTLRPLERVTLTPLEIGIHLTGFFQKVYNVNLNLKWPNDILTSEGKKCGGILCNYFSSELLIVGIGINLGGESDSEIEEDVLAGRAIPGKSLEKQEFQALPKEIYNCILSHRLRDDEVKIEWLKHCIHFQKKVTMVCEKQEIKGLFVGIGEGGEALIKDESSRSVIPFVSGSLIYY